ncbi:MAG TPA: hypothetical protein VFQ38_24320 [Longimicrobiales bacterium]|nr:hypothetical protein [Longimicrobiales bacterium]
MRTEHLQNVHLGWVAAGWLVAAAVTCAVFFVLTALGVIEPLASLPVGWSVVAVAIGFYVGGLFTGFNSLDAPILHGIAVGIFTLVVWFVLNVLTVLFFPDAGWAALTPAMTTGLLLLQMVAAVAGAWTGHVIAQRGGPDLTG